MELEAMTIKQLRQYAADNDISLPASAPKNTLLEIIKQLQPAAMQALYFANPVWHEELGKHEKGYDVMPAAEAAKWLKVSKRIRIATVQEVAAYYGV